MKLEANFSEKVNFHLFFDGKNEKICIGFCIVSRVQISDQPLLQSPIPLSQNTSRHTPTKLKCTPLLQTKEQTYASNIPYYT